MAYFTTREVEAFFGHRDPAVDMEEYLRVLNVAHDLPPLEALAVPVPGRWPSGRSTAGQGTPGRTRPLWTVRVAAMFCLLEVVLFGAGALVDHPSGIVAVIAFLAMLIGALAAVIIVYQHRS